MLCLTLQCFDISDYFQLKFGRIFSDDGQIFRFGRIVQSDLKKINQNMVVTFSVIQLTDRRIDLSHNFLRWR